jgi:hypothetical protein
MCRACRWMPWGSIESLLVDQGNGQMANSNSTSASKSGQSPEPSRPRIITHPSQPIFVDKPDGYGVRCPEDGYGLEAGGEEAGQQKGNASSPADSGYPARLCPFCAIPVGEPPDHRCARCGTTIPPEDK